MGHSLRWVVGMSLLVVTVAVLPFVHDRSGPGAAQASGAEEGADAAPPGIKKGIKVEYQAGFIGPKITAQVLAVRGKWVQIKYADGVRWIDFETGASYVIAE